MREEGVLPRSKLISGVLGVVLGAVIASGGFVTASTGESSTIHACIKAGRNGFKVTRIVQDPMFCSGKERVLSWNKEGPPGPAGPDGADGAEGLEGPPGPAGSAGPAGEDGAPGPEGSAGPEGSMGPEGPQGPAGETGTATFAGSRCPAGEAVTGFDDSGSPECSSFESSPPSAGGGSCPGAGPMPDPPVLISEIFVSPTSGEFIEIHNPASETVSLDKVFLADYGRYYKLADPNGDDRPGTADFRMCFPAGTTIPAHGYIVVSLESASDFTSAFGFGPDFDTEPDDPGAPDMGGVISGSAGLSNTAEMVVLFSWDGATEYIGDHDYLLYGSASKAMDKSGVLSGVHVYSDEIDPSIQSFAPAPPDGRSLVRCDFTEGTEDPLGGNGVTGHDETSENMSVTFRVSDTPTPGGPNTGCP